MVTFAPGMGLLYCDWVMGVAVPASSISGFVLGSDVLNM